MPVAIEHGKTYIIGIRKPGSTPQFPEWNSRQQTYNVTGSELLRYKTTPDEDGEKPHKIQTFDELIADNPLNLLHGKNYSVYEQIPDDQPKFLGEWTVLRLGPAQRTTTPPSMSGIPTAPVEVVNGSGYLFGSPQRGAADERLYVMQAENKRLADQLEHTQQVTSTQMSDMMNLMQAQMQQQNQLLDQLVQAKTAEATQQATLKGLESMNQLRDQMHTRELEHQKTLIENENSFGAKTLVELAGHLAPSINALLMGLADKVMNKDGGAAQNSATQQSGPNGAAPPPPPPPGQMQPVGPMLARGSGR